MVSSLIKKLVPAQVKQKIKLACGVPDTSACLAAMRQRGFEPKVAIDVGAYAGEWTTGLLRQFPETRVLMIEPQSAQRECLEAVTRLHPGTALSSVLLGPTAFSSVEFYQAETGSSVLRDPGNSGAVATQMAMTTLDSIARGTDFAHADFLKLDVQGFELEVLKGSEQVLRSAEAVMMEVNLIAVYEGSPLVHRWWRSWRRTGSASTMSARSIGAPMTMRFGRWT